MQGRSRFSLFLVAAIGLAACASAAVAAAPLDVLPAMALAQLMPSSADLGVVLATAAVGIPLPDGVVEKVASVVRAKFKVHNSTPYNGSDGRPSGYRVALSPVYDSNPASENAKFYQATPWGEIILGTVKPAVGEVLKPGAEFYVDFTPAG